MEKVKTLILDSIDAQLGKARRKDGSHEAMVFFTMRVRNAGTVHALPSVWIPPAVLDQAIRTLQELQAALGQGAGTPPPEQSH